MSPFKYFYFIFLHLDHVYFFFSPSFSSTSPPPLLLLLVFLLLLLLPFSHRSSSWAIISLSLFSLHVLRKSTDSALFHSSDIRCSNLARVPGSPPENKNVIERKKKEGVGWKRHRFNDKNNEKLSLSLSLPPSFSLFLSTSLSLSPPSLPLRILYQIQKDFK